MGGDKPASPDGRLGLIEGILFDPLRIIPCPLPELSPRDPLWFHREMVRMEGPVKTTWTTERQPDDDGSMREKATAAKEKKHAHQRTQKMYEERHTQTMASRFIWQITPPTNEERFFLRKRQ